MNTGHVAVPSAWPQAGEQLPKCSCEFIDGEALARYALASGDDNPVHLDLEIARRAGLAERPIHGMLMVGYFEPMIFAWRRDLAITTLSVKFLRPVLAGQRFETSGKVVRVSQDDVQSIIVRLMVHGFGGDKLGGDLAVLAEAHLRPRP
jgi:acyl dehydratase